MLRRILLEPGPAPEPLMRYLWPALMAATAAAALTLQGHLGR